MSSNVMNAVTAAANPAAGLNRMLDGEIAVVTGSTGNGTGTEIALQFAAYGARVVVTGRNVAAGVNVAAACREAGTDAVFVRADLTSEADCAQLVRRTVEEFGSLTVLVSSAIAPRDQDGRIGDITDEAWRESLEVNLTPLLWLYRYAIPVMTEAGHGSIVQIGSKVAERGTPGRAAYTVAKGAVHALARQVAIDYAEQGVRVNTIAPGYIVGKRRDPQMDEATASWVRASHLTRPVTTTDVAHTAAFLASERASAITGQTFMVDGGGSIGRAVSLG